MIASEFNAHHGGDYSHVAVLIPCYNEASCIGRVVKSFRETLPGACVYVYDNNSTDSTALQAVKAGAIVKREPLQGKGHVIRRMFADIDADIYVMVDGDDTYDVNAAPSLIRALRENALDLVNGRRVSTLAESYRLGHKFGNWFLTSMVASIFGKRITDMLSGYKILSRRFVKTFPCLSTGFEIETEIAVHALELMMPMCEMPVAYGQREVGSESKLRTIRDGVRISRTILRLLRAERPMAFFGAIFALLAIPAAALGFQIFLEFEATGLVLRLPTAVLCTGMMLLAFLSLVCGMILETVTLGRREQKRLLYLAFGAPTTTSQFNPALLETV